MQGGINPGGPTQTQRHLKSNPNVQRTFHLSVSRSCRGFPDKSMGQVVTTDNSYLKPIAPIERGSQHLRVCLPSWQLWLQSDATCAHGMCCPVSNKTRQMKNIWWAFGWWFLFENVGGTLQDTCDIRQKDTSQTSHQHGVLQAQIYHSTYNHTSGCHCQCIQQIAASHPRTLTLQRWCTFRSSGKDRKYYATNKQACNQTSRKCKTSKGGTS